MKKLLKKMFGYRVIREEKEDRVLIKKGLVLYGSLSGYDFENMTDAQLLEEFLSMGKEEEES